MKKFPKLQILFYKTFGSYIVKILKDKTSQNLFKKLKKLKIVFESFPRAKNYAVKISVVNSLFQAGNFSRLKVHLKNFIRPLFFSQS